MDIARLKIITYHAINTTGTLIGIMLCLGSLEVQRVNELELGGGEGNEFSSFLATILSKPLTIEIDTLE